MTEECNQSRWLPPIGTVRADDDRSVLAKCKDAGRTNTNLGWPQPGLRHRAAGLAHSVLVRFDATLHRFMLPRTPLDWTQGDLFEGLRCFHSGAFFEAHEHWESVWLASQEPEKTFLQGLIQVAAAFHRFSAVTARGPFPCCDLPCAVWTSIQRSLPVLWSRPFAWPSVHGSKPSKQLRSLRRRPFRASTDSLRLSPGTDVSHVTDITRSFV